MQIFQYYVVPESKIDEIFIEEEIKFLIKVCIRDYKLYTDFSEFKSIIKDRYSLWRKNYEERRIQ